MRRTLVAGSAAVLLGLLAGCGSDDGAGVRGGSASASAGAGSGSGSMAERDSGGPAKDKQLQAAVASYRGYLLDQLAGLRKAAAAFTGAVRAGDVARAKALYAPSRVNWGAVKPVAGLTPAITASLDRPAGDVASPADPAFTGWHRLERLLWAQGDAAAAVPYANRLDADLGRLAKAVAKAQITPKAMVLGASGLVEQLFKDKINGTGEPYSHTDLWDFAAAVAGSQAVFRTVTPLLQSARRPLFDSLQHDYQAVATSLAKYAAPGGGYQPYGRVTAADKAALRVRLAALSQDLAKVPAALGIS